ncbi:hypothetical protein BD809_101469 [Aquimarina intermedia]|uniref:Uncharacterized protein n=1 Tax=Aquimarina intermedia TaxID=350814 RepID=A0A5S5CD64_9FLAO|nr:hypothetical protein BD809_101469 [Aquimarina intermedia]
MRGLNGFFSNFLLKTEKKLIEVALPVAMEKTQKIAIINLNNFLVVNQSAHYHFILQNAPFSGNELPSKILGIAVGISYR